jgi:hypothetical protein
MSGLSNVDFSTLEGDAVNTQCFQAEVILDRLKETTNLPRQENYSFNVMSQQHPAQVAEGWSKKGQKGHLILDTL